MKRYIGTLIALVLTFMPSLAQAHSGEHSLNGWQDGFNHPLHGWDHLLAMLAVGGGRNKVHSDAEGAGR
jgi:hydrogenase/urease accessory protein HupE